jgi:hypothetical protein
MSFIATAIHLPAVAVSCGLLCHVWLVDVCSGFDPKSHSYTNEVEGGAMVVVAGTGAGQYRRVVSWPGSMNGTGGVFEIDSPLTATLDATSVVEIMPMRGKNIFHKTHYADVGAFQFYGLGVDNMVVGMTMERGGGFIAWGQTRADPNHGAFGFVNPNLMNEFVDNTVIEGCKSRPPQQHRTMPRLLCVLRRPCILI